MGSHSWRRNLRPPDSTGDTPQRPVFLDTRMLRRHMAEEDRFFRSNRGQLIEQFILYSALLLQAPNAQKDDLARELIAFSDDAARAIQTLDAMRARQAEEGHWEYEALGMPKHPGFERLSFTCEREKRFEEAIALCAEAKGQGWVGDWDRRIGRCTAKLAGSRKHPRHPNQGAA